MKLSIADLKNPELAGLVNRCIIVFKGKVLKHVIEANEEEGYVIVYKYRDGKFQLTDDVVETVTWHGRTRIIDPLDNDLAGIYLK